MPSITDNVNKEYLFPILKDLLSQCTLKQQQFFLRMYPAGVENIEPEKIPFAIWQCKNTLAKNAKD